MSTRWPSRCRCRSSLPAVPAQDRSCCSSAVHETSSSTRGRTPWRKTNPRMERDQQCRKSRGNPLPSLRRCRSTGRNRLAAATGARRRTWSRGGRWPKRSATTKALTSACIRCADEWGRGKSGFKPVVYMSCGAVCVASPVGGVTEFIRNGENGILAESGSDWSAALGRLLSDERLRTRLGAAGRQTILDFYCVRVQAPRLLHVLERAAAG